MIQQLTQNKLMQIVKPIKNTMNLLKNSGNPQALFSQMISQNPQMKQVMDYVNQNGGNAKDAFYKMANEKGVNPDDILNMLK